MAFLIDDLLLFPLKAVVQNIKKAAEEDLGNEEKEIMANLAGLYYRLESGEIDERQFDEQETASLSRLETIQKILNPEPPLTKLEKLQKHFPEEFETEPENGTELHGEVESSWQDHPGELVTEVESASRLGFASLRSKSGAIRPEEISPVAMERKACGLQPTKLRSVGLGSAKPKES